jgi:hypothetical protein
LANSGVNGIIHHSPHAKVEICSCSDYGIFDTCFDFVGDYRLDLTLSRVDSSLFSTNLGRKKVKILDERVPLLVGELPTTRLLKSELESETGTSLIKKHYSLLSKTLNLDNSLYSYYERFIA